MAPGGRREFLSLKLPLDIICTSHGVIWRDKNDIIAEVFKSKALVVGSPTINKGILTSVAALLEEIRGLSFKGKKAAVFGAYGGSGESVGVLKESLEKAGFRVVDDGLKALWNPSEDSRRECHEYGRKLAAELA